MQKNRKETKNVFLTRDETDPGSASAEKEAMKWFGTSCLWADVDPALTILPMNHAGASITSRRVSADTPGAAILQRVTKDASPCVSLRPHSTLIIQRDRNTKHLHVSAQVCGRNRSWRLVSTLAGSRTPPASARHHTRQFDSTPT